MLRICLVCDAIDYNLFAGRIWLQNRKSCICTGMYFNTDYNMLMAGLVLYYFLFRDISGETVFSGVKVTVYKDGMGEKKILEYNAASKLSRLTSHEAELIPLMRQGLSVKEIAWHLGISPIQ